MPELRSFDYIIVGGGTAACVLANRLTEDSAVRVLMIEAGPEPESPWIKMPLAMGKLFTHPTLNWGFYTEPEAKLNNRPIFWPRGRVLGGSSSINGSAYVRGQAEDYDGWRRLGNVGWGWSDVLPYFNKLERREDLPAESRNSAGMLAVNYPTYVHPITRAFIEGCVRNGLPASKDLNGAVSEGISLMPNSVRKGVRQSAVEAYLRPVRQRKNLVVETSALARRVLTGARRATGVEYERNGTIQKALATREVILAVGSIGSPQILMLSGIGPGRHLQEHGIAVVADVAGVGENLHDHPYTTCTYRTTGENSLNPQLKGLRVAWHALNYYVAKRGPLTNGASQATALARGLPDAPCPDLQIVFRPMSHVFDSSGKIAPDPIPRITGGVAYVRPKSRGRLLLKSTDPRQAPAMFANYLAVASDEEGLLTGVKLVRRIFQTEPLKSRMLGEDAPGDACRTDADLREYLHKAANTFCHPSGTCKMGQDAMSVVDERLRVRGIESLRVIDASIMPALPSAGPAPAVFMIAEKGADLIKEDRSRGVTSVRSDAVASAVR
ncbi:MAG TPA: GMC family oxidoreductase N-terminal domain-containing protein [Candidatus Acidoferrales bacterium]|nr:GMC family oxidoreductase N-terminal domain-containing protein [Candidatus Acidoferrales bacterium]